MPRPADAFYPEREEHIRHRLCVRCTKDIDCCSFRDELSEREYKITGMCQECQDWLFGGFEDE